MADMQSLEARVLFLERGHRRLMALCLTLAVALAASVLWRALRVPLEGSAQRFVLKATDGRTRGQWGPTDVLAGEIDGEAQHASATCLDVVDPKCNGVHLCAPWDPYGGPSSVLSEETGASLHVAPDAFTVSILGRTSRSRTGNRGALVLGVHSDRASLGVSDKDGRRAWLAPDGMAVYDSTGGVAYKTPGTTIPLR